MKFLATTISLFILFSAGAFASGEGEEKTNAVKVLCFAYPPLVVNEGQGTGFLVDLVRAGFRKMDIEASFQFLPAKRAFHVFSNSGGLLLTSGGLSPDNFQFLKVLRMEAALFGKGPTAKVKNTAVLRGLKFGTTAAGRLGLDAVKVSSYKAATKVYLSGRVQAILGMELPIKHLGYTKYPELASIKVLRKPVYTDHAGVSAGPKDAETLKLLVKGLEKLKASGEMAELADKAFIWDKSNQLKEEILEDFEISPNPTKDVLNI